MWWTNLGPSIQENTYCSAITGKCYCWTQQHRLFSQTLCPEREIRLKKRTYCKIPFIYSEVEIHMLNLNREMWSLAIAARIMISKMWRWYSLGRGCKGTFYSSENDLYPILYDSYPRTLMCKNSLSSTVQIWAIYTLHHLYFILW